MRNKDKGWFKSLKKNNRKSQTKEAGFIALLFLLSVTFTLSLATYSLIEERGFILRARRNFAIQENIREAVKVCKGLAQEYIAFGVYSVCIGGPEETNSGTGASSQCIYDKDQDIGKDLSFSYIGQNSRYTCIVDSIYKISSGYGYDSILLGFGRNTDYKFNIRATVFDLYTGTSTFATESIFRAGEFASSLEEKYTRIIRF